MPAARNLMWPALTFLLLALCLWVYLRGREELSRAERRHAQAVAELGETRKAQDETIYQIRTRQAAIFNSMVESILILDQEGRVHSTNQSLQSLFGIERDILGMRLMEAFRSHELLRIVESAREEGMVKGCELKITVMAQTRFLEVNAAAIQRAGGEPEGLIVIFHDFTRLKELENMRREFVANVSHELRTPLTLIKGYVETLLDGAKEDPEVATKFLQTIHKHSNRLAFLIEDLLTLSQLESGSVMMHPQVTLLSPIARRVVEELQTLAEEKEIKLYNELSDEIEINADADRLQQVFYNLVDNAIKYGNRGGKVRIRGKLENETIQVEVQDDGPGIPLEARARIFERFFRVERARSREAGGTGLGLAIVKHIIQAHGGSVWVESEPSQGSTFTFRVPANLN
jgi:two-component system phosphate regulon sensor histidine kinase PhoR